MSKFLVCAFSMFMCLKLCLNVSQKKKKKKNLCLNAMPSAFITLYILFISLSCVLCHG